MLKTNLKKYFGYDSFRDGQEEVIQEALNGNDVLNIMPTSHGKSLCFQLPALIKDGLSIVVSPLISLMKDQVDTLVAKGINAAYINSSTSEKDYAETIKKINRGELKLLYVAPERLSSSSFINYIKEKNISFVVVDEVHCVSMYGADFRPDYLKIKEFRKRIGSPPIVAVTATATPEVVDDISEKLGLKNEKRFCSGFERENLIINNMEIVREGRNKDKTLDEFKVERIVKIINAYKTGIVYCSTRKAVESVYRLLKSHGVNCDYYHAERTQKDREKVQEDFMSKKADVIVATIAFGMGVDRGDVRFVVYHSIASSIEDMYQGFGRAGRDGKTSYCELLYNGYDVKIQEFFILGKNPSKEQVEMVYEELEAMFRKNKILKKSLTDTYEILSDIFDRDAIVGPAIATAVALLEEINVVEKVPMESNGKGFKKCLKFVKPLTPELLDKIDWKSRYERMARDKKKLSQVVAYAKDSSCSQLHILKYFHQKNAKPCGKCSHCSGKSVDSYAKKGQLELF